MPREDISDMIELLEVVSNSEEPKGVKSLAQCIAKISQGVDALFQESGLNEKAIMVLLQHQTKLPQKTLRTVLGGIKDLHENYVIFPEENNE